MSDRSTRICPSPMSPFMSDHFPLPYLVTSWYSVSVSVAVHFLRFPPRTGLWFSRGAFRFSAWGVVFWLWLRTVRAATKRCVVMEGRRGGERAVSEVRIHSRSRTMHWAGAPQHRYMHHPSDICIIRQIYASSVRPEWWHTHCDMHRCRCPPHCPPHCCPD